MTPLPFHPRTFDDDVPDSTLSLGVIPLDQIVHGGSIRAGTLSNRPWYNFRSIPPY